MPSMIQRMHQRFGLALIDPQALPPAAASHVPQRLATLGVAEAQRRVAFPLPLPAWLPQGLQVGDALMGPAGGVSIFLRAPGSPDFLLLHQVQGSGGAGYGVDAARVEQVRVAGRPAAYARGGWRGPGVWDETMNLTYLSWEANGVTYTLHGTGLRLSREALIRIAESLR